MFVITQAMIDAGNLEVERSSDATLIQSFNGLGGGRTMADAPPEIAKWFNTACAVSAIIFDAMDAVSDEPFGLPVIPAMSVVGDRVLELLIMAKFAEGCLTQDPALEAAITEELKPFVFNKEAAVSLTYARMRTVGEQAHLVMGTNS